MPDALRNLVAYVKGALPTSEEIVLDSPDGVRHTLGVLVENGLLERSTRGPTSVGDRGASTSRRRTTATR
jgi:hypothetical protein